MPKIKEKNVFISHYRKDEKYIEKLKKDLGKRGGYKLNNYSIDSSKENNASDESYIKQMLGKHMDSASVLICLVGDKTHTRPYVDWEIEHAMRKDKRIIGVYLPSEENADLPENLDKYADAVVSWKEEKIIAAIGGENIFCNPDGTQRSSNPSYGDMKRVSCQ